MSKTRLGRYPAPRVSVVQFCATHLRFCTPYVRCITTLPDQTTKQARPGRKKQFDTPTLSDIARETRTSVSTVSRVLAGGVLANRISDATRRRVREAAHRLGYRPNLIARSLRTRQSHTVALLVSDIANPWFGQIAKLVENSLHRHGYSLMLCNSSGDADRESEYLRLLPQKGIDGLILVPMLRTRKALYDYIPPDLPLVILDRPIPGIACSVSSDEGHLCGLLSDTLDSVGVRNIAIVCGPQYIITHRDRCMLLSKRFHVLASHEGRAQKETGQQAYARFSNIQPDAVVCTNNFLGQGYIDAMTKVDHPPIIGCFDDIPMMNHLPIPIACANQDVDLLAESCVNQLLPQLRRESFKPEPILLPSRAVTNVAFQRLYESRNKG